MVCRPCQAAGTQSEAAYEQQMTGEGPSYRERQKVRFQCRDCGEEMAAGYLVGRSMTQNGRASEDKRIWKRSPIG